MQRPAIVTRGELAVRVGGLPARLVRHHQDEGVQPRVVRVDLAQALIGDLSRTDVTRPPTASEFFNGQHGH